MSQAQRTHGAKQRARAKRRAVIGYLHPGEVAGEFMDSVCRTLTAETREDGLLGPGGGYINLRSGPRIAEARSQLVETFLNAEIFKPAQWLLMVDSDMVFPPEALRRLVDIAEEAELPILGGLCFAGSSPSNCYPTLYSLHQEDGGWVTERHEEIPPDALVKVGATGAAALLVHRSALMTMYRAYEFLPDGQRNAYPWFVEGHVDYRGRPMGEDIAFCIRAQGIGLPVHVHTGVEFGHVKNVILDTNVWKANRP